MAFAHSMLTALRHPACACQQRRLSGHGQPLTDGGSLHKSPERKRRDHEGGLPEHRSELCSRKTGHPVVFSWQTQFAGAAHGILPCKQRGRAPRTPKRAVFTKNTTSCRFFLANAVCWCCARHPAMQTTRAGSPNTEASVRRLGVERVPLSKTLSPSRRASGACLGSPPGGVPGQRSPIPHGALNFCYRIGNR
jgi:hypothetical protein